MHNLPPTMYCANLNIVVLSHNPALHAKTKHMELDIFFLREKVINKTLVVKHILATVQIDDIFVRKIDLMSFSLHLILYIIVSVITGNYNS